MLPWYLVSDGGALGGCDSGFCFQLKENLLLSGRVFPIEELGFGSLALSGDHGEAGGRSAGGRYCYSGG